MYMREGFLNIYDDHIVDSNQPLLITSAGHYRLIKRQYLRTFRPEGREDYQLIYVVKGKAIFLKNNRNIVVSEGGILIYRPSEIQQYEYSLINTSEVYWIHFTGSQASSILDSLCLNQDDIVFGGNSSMLTSVIDSIITEIQLKEKGFGSLCELYFRQLLIMIQRGDEKNKNKVERTYSLIRRIEEDMHANYNNNILIEEYAKKYNISICWFIRIFKNKTGRTPQAYIMELRIRKAKELLRYSDLQVAEIASIVGYENALYFSRIFKKSVGVSPMGYKKEKSRVYTE